MRFITIGELLMRLSPPNYEKIRTTNSFIINFGGAEANVAVSLANLGVDASVFTVVPDNDIGKSAVRYLKANDVHTSPIIFFRRTYGNVLSGRRHLCPRFPSHL